MDWQALFLSLRLAALTTIILIAVAIPLSYWLAFGRARLRHWIEAVVSLPLVLPPTVLGFYLLVFLGPQTWFGRAGSSLLGHSVVFSFEGLVAGSVVYSLPFAVQPILAGFSGVDPELREAAVLLSPPRSTVRLRALLPLVKASLLAAAVLTFAHTMGEFGVVLMIGGGIPGVTKTLSISIYDQVQNFAYSEAARTSLVLLSVSFLALVTIYRVRGRGIASSQGEESHD